MPLYKGQSNFKKNLTELVTGKVGTARKKAIYTLAKREGISFKEARMKQAVKIANVYKNKQ